MILINNRTMVVPNNDRYIGTVQDDNSDIRRFQIKRVTTNGVDLAALGFSLDLLLPSGAKDTVPLEKEIQEKHIVLIWTVTGNQLRNAGTIFANIRGADVNGTVKWASNKGAFYVEAPIGTPGDLGAGSNLSLFEQYEQRIRRLTERLTTEMAEAKRIAEEGRQAAVNAGVAAVNDAAEGKRQAVEAAERAIAIATAARQEIEERISAAKAALSSENALMLNQLLESAKSSFSAVVDEYKLVLEAMNQQADGKIQELEQFKQSLNTLHAEIEEAYRSGALIGPKGEKGADGKDGRDATVHTVSGEYAFHINGNGHLELHYKDGTVPPDFSIDGRGHLILTI